MNQFLLGLGIGIFIGEVVGLVVASFCRAAANGDRQAELAQSRRDDVAELGQMFDKKA